MSRSRRSLALLPLTLCLALPACGGSEEDAVRDSLKTFAQSAVDGDGEGACDQLTKSARDQLKIGGQDCAAIFSKLDSGSKEDAEEQLDAIDDAKVTIDGDKASVKGPESGDESIAMVKEDGDWKVNAGAE